MRSFNSPHAFAQKVFSALDYCLENRSKVNDIFYFSTLKHIDKAYLDAKVMPLEIAEKIIETWVDCYRGLLADKHLLNESGHEDMTHWQEFLMLPQTGLH